MAGRLRPLARGVDQREDVADDDREQDGQQARESAEVNADHNCYKHRNGRGQQIAFEVIPRGTRQREPNDSDHGSGHYRRQEEADRVDAREMDDDANQEIDDARDQDPAVGQIVMAGAAALYCKDREPRKENEEPR